MTSTSVPFGLGHHIADVPVQNLGQIGFLGNINGTFSIFAAAWSKTSFALTLLRVMAGDKWARYFLWFAMITMNILMLNNALFQWIRCDPISKTWNPMEPGTCWPAGVQSRYGIVAGGKAGIPTKRMLWLYRIRTDCSKKGYSALIDFILAFLPWKLVWSLQMKTKEKLGVAVAMSLGIL